MNEPLLRSANANEKEDRVDLDFRRNRKVIVLVKLFYCDKCGDKNFHILQVTFLSSHPILRLRYQRGLVYDIIS